MVRFREVPSNTCPVENQLLTRVGPRYSGCRGRGSGRREDDRGVFRRVRRRLDAGEEIVPGELT